MQPRVSQASPSRALFHRTLGSPPRPGASPGIGLRSTLGSPPRPALSGMNQTLDDPEAILQKAEATLREAKEQVGKLAVRRQAVQRDASIQPTAQRSRSSGSDGFLSLCMTADAAIAAAEHSRDAAMMAIGAYREQLGEYHAAVQRGDFDSESDASTVGTAQENVGGPAVPPFPAEVQLFAQAADRCRDAANASVQAAIKVPLSAGMVADAAERGGARLQDQGGPHRGPAAGSSQNAGHAGSSGKDHRYDAG